MAKIKEKKMITRSGIEVIVKKGVKSIRAFIEDELAFDSKGDNNLFQKWLKEN